MPLPPRRVRILTAAYARAIVKSSSSSPFPMGWQSGTMSAGVAWLAKPALTLFVPVRCLRATPHVSLEAPPISLILAFYRDIDKYLARHFCSTIAPLCRQVPTYRDTYCRDIVRKQIATCAAGTVAILHGPSISF